VTGPIENFLNPALEMPIWTAADMKAPGSTLDV
jgi:hypothetical protein